MVFLIAKRNSLKCGVAKIHHALLYRPSNIKAPFASLTSDCKSLIFSSDLAFSSSDRL